MSQVLLNIALINLCRRGEPGAQGMSREHCQPFGFRQIGSDAALQNGCLISQATCLSERRASRARLPSREVRTKTGPKSIFAKCSHCSSAWTGQVWSLEPRPTSTSRHPVLAFSVSRAPSSKISIQPPESGVSSLCMSRLTTSDRRRPPA